MNFDRIEILIEQNRFDLAEIELKAILAQDPQNYNALYLFTSLAISAKSKEAKERLKAFMGIFPDDPIGFYLESRYLLQHDDVKGAYKSIQKALSFAPDDADFWAMNSLIELDLNKPEKALESAEKALELEAELTIGLNARSLALQRLGRTREAAESSAQALHQNPESSYSHYNQGMQDLENRNYDKAMQHFSEALRIDPNDEEAKDGLLMCIKANNVFFRSYLRYQFWISSLSDRNRWFVVIGFYFAFRFVRKASLEQPHLGFIFYPLLALMGLFALSTWLIDPISNSIMLLHPYGKHLVKKDDRISALAVMTALFSGIIVIAFAILFKNGDLFLPAIILFALSLIASNITNETKGNSLRNLSYGLIGLGLTAIAYDLLFSPGSVSFLSIIFLILFIPYQFYSNYMNLRS